MENTAITQNSCETTKQITLEGWLYFCEDIYSLFYQYLCQIFQDPAVLFCSACPCNITKLHPRPEWRI